MLLISNFFSLFFKSKVNIFISVCSFLVSQFMIFFIYNLDPIKNDTNVFFSLPIGMILLPSFISILLFGPLFIKYLESIPHLRNLLLFNANFLSNFKITLLKIIYFYLLSVLFLIMNWTFTYLVYFNDLGFKPFIYFLGISLFFLFFLTNIFVFLDKWKLDLKFYIFIFTIILLLTFSFYTLNTIYSYHIKDEKNVEMTKWLLIQKHLLPFYYALLGFDTRSLSQELQLFIGDQKSFLIIFLSIYSFGLLFFLINLTFHKKVISMKKN